MRDVGGGGEEGEGGGGWVEGSEYEIEVREIMCRGIENVHFLTCMYYMKEPFLV